MQSNTDNVEEGTPCQLYLPYLEYGRHRLEAISVSILNVKDSTAASVEWEVSHCNDPNRYPSQYAKVEDDGSLTCVNCPHKLGANCLDMDVRWEGVYANPGYWTAGDRRDTYYKCPFKLACLGGKTNETQMNGTIIKDTVKSRCAIGYTGVVCAICDNGFYLADEFCIECPDAKSDSQLLVGGVFGILFAMCCMATSMVQTLLNDRGR